MHKRRRQTLKSLLALSACSLLPRFKNDEWSVVTEARAQVLEGISLGLQALSAFQESSDGLTSFLLATKRLTEENIRLSRELLASIARLENQIADLPQHFREALTENSEYQVRATTDAMVSNLTFVNERMTTESWDAVPEIVSTRLKEIVARGGELSGVAATPFGRGPMGALCAPLAMGAAAKAHTMLGDRNSMKADIVAKYIPWLEAIVNKEYAGSLPNRILDEHGRVGKILASYIEQTTSEAQEHVAIFFHDFVLRRLQQKNPILRLARFRLEQFRETVTNCLKTAESAEHGERCVKTERVHHYDIIGDYYLVATLDESTGKLSDLKLITEKDLLAQDESDANSVVRSVREKLRGLEFIVRTKNYPRDKHAFVWESKPCSQVREALEPLRMSLIVPVLAQMRVIEGYRTLELNTHAGIRRTRAIFSL